MLTCLRIFDGALFQQLSDLNITKFFGEDFDCKNAISLTPSGEKSGSDGMKFFVRERHKRASDK